MSLLNLRYDMYTWTSILKLTTQQNIRIKYSKHFESHRNQKSMSGIRITLEVADEGKLLLYQKCIKSIVCHVLKNREMVFGISRRLLYIKISFYQNISSSLI